MHGDDPVIWQLDIAGEVEVVVGISLFAGMAGGGLIAGSGMRCRLPPCYSAFWKMNDFSAGTLFYIGGDEGETAPFATFEGCDNFLYIECHEGNIIGGVVGGKGQVAGGDVAMNNLFYFYFHA